MNKILTKINNYNGENFYLNVLLIAVSAYLCSFWAQMLGQPSLFSIFGVILNFYFLWKQKSLFMKISSSIVFNIVFSFFIDFTLYETTKSFLELDNIWRLSTIVLMSGLVRVPSHYVLSIIIHILQFYNIKEKKYNNVNIILIAGLLAIVERYLYVIVPTEVGFAFLGFIEYLGLLSIFSLLIYSFLVYYISLSVVFYCNKQINSLTPTMIMTLIIVGSSLFLSKMQLWQNDYSQTDFLKVKVVQYPFHELKNNKENQDPEELMQSTLIPILKHNKSDLTLFSESSLPYIYENFHNLRQQSNISMFIQSKSDLLFSAIKKENNKLYNTSLLFQTGKLPQIYYKKYLFPVGERELLPVTILNYGNKKIDLSLDSKDSAKLFHTNKDFYFIPMQCFENYNPYYIGQYPQDKIASFFTVQSNESWIQDIRLRDLAKLFVQVRSAENSLYGFKIDSMGPSFVVNPDGKIDYITYYPKGSFDYNVPRKINHSFNYFFQFGYLPFLIFIILHSLLTFLFYKNKNKLT